MILATVCSALILVSYAVQLSVPVISDETVTMANAAWATGRDWSLMIAHLGGPYYRFIQALMTVPLFAFLDDPDMIYRLSMVLQALVHASTVPVIYLICRRHLKVDSPLIAALIGMAVCFVPSIALYVLYYRGDYLLSVLPWYVLLFFLEATQAANEDRSVSRARYTFASVLCCAFAYMAHTRGIVLGIALTMCAVLMRLLMKQRSLNWPVCISTAVLLFCLDHEIGGILKEALYSISGLNSNAFESTDMGGYLNIFSLHTIKEILLLCLSWLNTLIVTTQGLVLVGGAALLVILCKIIKESRLPANSMIKDRKERCLIEGELAASSVVSAAEKITALFSFLVFAGYYAVGALFFKGVYYALLVGDLTRRVDRLLYDRYSVCGAGMMVFLALYVLCCRREWLGRKCKLFCMALAAAVFALFLWKFLPLAVKYTGYIYNTISLNTFQIVEDASTILSGAYYGKAALVAACVLGLVLMAAVLVLSLMKGKRMAYAVLALVLVSDLALIQVNYGKIRKASNDYVKEATADVAEFLQEFEDDISDEYPYVLKGGLSGVKIQFYQSQLMEYQLLGKKQAKKMDLENCFIISSHDDINLTWYEDDYYLFEDFDYENAEYDIVYVKGDVLAEKLETLGYSMILYEVE
ncbi:MAG: hypothetical protein LUG99_18550 [Lachnospiraceae bacterium]|nr:hypothetical protein [Lachnospiraceae bacterium]